jgi:hypothetical protein
MPEPQFYSADFVNSLSKNARAGVMSRPEPRKTIRDYFKIGSKGSDSTRETSDRDSIWTVSQWDPATMLGTFDCLSLKPGTRLDAYCYKSSLGSNCFVYALPQSASLPDPSLCPKSSRHFLKPPVPPEAMDDVMSAITGDGSALSYLQASILARELREFGAGWHGLKWSLQFVRDQNPAASGSIAEANPGQPAVGWKWLESVAEWRPLVSINETEVTVEFYTTCEYYDRRIVRNIDTYQAGNYCFTSKETIVADGGPGLCL